MKIVYFYQYFSTPKGAWGTRVYDFAKEWVAKGHDVTVVTSIYAKSDLKAEKFIETQYFDGIRVKIINIKVDNRQSFLRRIWSFIQYMTVSSWYAIKLPADVVIASSGPITVGFPGLVAHYLRRRKFVFETRDLWPEGAIEIGILKNRLLIKLAYAFERWCYRASSFIITLSPGMSDNIRKRFGITKIDDVTNSANIELFSTPSEKTTAFTGKTYALYTGNIGLVNNSEWLFEAAKILNRRGRNDIIILLIGEGQQREMLEKRAVEENVPNFIRLGLIPKVELVAYIQQALISLVPLKGNRMLDTSSPNKFFESLAAGVPVIQNTNGWMKKFLIQNDVGFTVDPNDPEELAELLIFLDSEKDRLKEIGRKAMKVAIEKFDRRILAQKMLDILIKVHGSEK